jgi:hypothetical protein
MRACAGYALTLACLGGCNFSIDPGAFSPAQTSDAGIRRLDAGAGSDARVDLDAGRPDAQDPFDHDGAGALFDGGSDAAIPYFDGEPDELLGWCVEHCWMQDPADAGCDWAMVPCLGIKLCVDVEPCEPCRYCPFPALDPDDPEAGAGH